MICTEIMVCTEKWYVPENGMYRKMVCTGKWYVPKKSTASGTGSLLAKGGFHTIR